MATEFMLLIQVFHITPQCNFVEFHQCNFAYLTLTDFDKIWERFLKDRRGSRVIHETFVSRQFQRKNKRVLINVAAGNKRDLNITPLYCICSF